MQVKLRAYDPQNRRREPFEALGLRRSEIRCLAADCHGCRRVYCWRSDFFADRVRRRDSRKGQLRANPREEVSRIHRAWIMQRTKYVKFATVLRSSVVRARAFWARARARVRCEKQQTRSGDETRGNAREIASYLSGRSPRATAEINENRLRPCENVEFSFVRRCFG